MPRPASLARPGYPARPVTWALVAAAVLVQIVYPLTPEGTRTPITVLSVLVFAAAALADVVRWHGPRGGGVLLLVAGGGGLLAEAIGVHTGFPFGSYTYTGTLGPQLLGVPLVVPLAWVMMAWPALVVGRTLGAARPRSRQSGAVALASWDVFLDPQMVDAGHWRWSGTRSGTAAGAGRAADQLRGLVAGGGRDHGAAAPDPAPAADPRARRRRCTCGPTSRRWSRTWSSSACPARR